MFDIVGGIKALAGIGETVDELFTSDHELAQEKTKQLATDLKAFIAGMQPLLAQLAIDQQEAKHPSRFVAGARPAMKWCFVAILAVGGVIAPVFNWLVGLVAWAIAAENVPAMIFLPVLSWDEILALGGGGGLLYGLRGMEKLKGVARENMQHTPTKPPEPLPAPPDDKWG